MQGTITWFSAEIFKDGKSYLSEDAVENVNQDAGNGLAYREDSQSTAFHCECNNVVMDTSDEVSTKNQQDSITCILANHLLCLNTWPLLYTV
jgi:hypothetical protein